MGAHRKARAVWQFHPAQPAATSHASWRNFGSDASFDKFLQYVEGMTIRGQLISVLPLRVLQSFNPMMRHMHEYNMKRNIHWFFIPYKITIRHSVKPADPCTNLLFNFHNAVTLGLPGYASATQQLLAQKSPSRAWILIFLRLVWPVRNHTTGLPSWHVNRLFRLSLLLWRMTSYLSLGDPCQARNQQAE